MQGERISFAEIDCADLRQGHDEIADSLVEAIVCKIEDDFGENPRARIDQILIMEKMVEYLADYLVIRKKDQEILR